MAEQNKEETTEQQVQEEDIVEMLKKITPFIQIAAPRFIEYHKIKAPQIILNQVINFIIMIGILVAVSFLAYNKIIDSSAATGLIGAVIGYVFGGLYRQKD